MNATFASDSWPRHRFRVTIQAIRVIPIPVLFDPI
jgi:hypothetical protein